MDDRVTRRGPEYRPPVAAGQSYPPLGYGPDGDPRFTYDDQLRSEAGPQPDPVPEPTPVPPAPTEAARADRRGMAVGLAAILVGVICLGVALNALFSRGDEPVTRSAPPSSQSTDDPYLQGIPDQSQERRSPGPETGPRVPTRGAAVTYEVESGAATLLYVDDTSVELAQTRGGPWTKSVRGTDNALLRIMVIPQGAEPASCAIKVDGREVARASSEDRPGTPVLDCRYTG
ncbi:hypothetical protein [Gordonia shandongensis]|uniref:hypothetical protein n=1 Tax=Gordonia shandongensis TaxID=376351 RepID=UPI000410C93A|nr:hypothetical protein [Gordonia shandongensis]